MLIKKGLSYLFIWAQALACVALGDGVVKAYHENELWTSPSKNASESMPLGGGDIGCNVWVEKGDVMLYVQRSGAFSEQGEYLKLGRLRITLSNNPFEDGVSFKQEQNLADGNMTITAVKDGIETKILLWVDIFNHSVHILAESSAEIDMKLAYENWRFEDVSMTESKKYRALFSCFQFEGSPYPLTKYKDSVAYKDKGIVAYHRNKDYTESPLLMMSVQGFEDVASQLPNYNKHRTSGAYVWGTGFSPSSTGSGVYHVTPYHSWSIQSDKPSNKHHVIMSTHIAQNDTLDEWMSQLEAKKQIDAQSLGNQQKNIAWWNAFWERSYIIVDPKKKDLSYWNMGRNYQLFRYQLGSNLYGDYPTRFNGGNFTFDPSLVHPSLIEQKQTHDPDWRAWGGDVFTQQNQRLVYWPMLKSGDFDGMAPEFELYMKALPGALVKTKKFFGHQGAMFTEYLHSSGMDITCGWGWDPKHPNSTGQRIRRNVVPFGDPIINDLATKGVNITKHCEEGMILGAISFHWMGQIEHSYMILEKRRFTGEDIAPYMPFIKESMMFFNEHYQLRQRMRNGKNYDENGKLVIYPSTACESYKGAKNPADVIAGLEAVLECLLSEENAHYINQEERDYYQKFLSSLPDLPKGKVKGDSVILAADFFGQSSPDECPHFYPLFPFNRYDLEDKEEMELFRNTWTHGTFWKDNVVSWHQDGIFYARMGMIDKASNYNRKKLANSDRRFPTFWGPGMDWVPDHNWGGSGMSGLQEMVLQTVGKSIHVLPCWPEGKDVIFKLHAPYQTVVEIEYIDGKITKCKVSPKSRMKDVTFFGTESD